MPSTATAERFLDAVRRKDFAALEHCFHPQARLRALLPGGLWDEQGAADVVAVFRYWFAENAPHELVDGKASAVADRVHLHYRFRVGGPADPPAQVEQQAYLQVVDDRIAAMNLVCSGIRPV